MRVLRFLTKLVLLSVGGGAAALLIGKRLRPAPLPPWNEDDALDDAQPPPWMPDTLAADPGDPVQSLDEVPAFHIEELDVDAQSQIDAGEDFDLAEAESGTEATAEEDEQELDVTSPEPTLDTIEATMHDTGDLYGGHTPPATDREHPDEDQAMDEGQSWTETLQASSIENGAMPEFELDDIVDDSEVDHPPHPSDTRDRPVADRGSGGPGGV
jgi:hypothetical protein